MARYQNSGDPVVNLPSSRTISGTYPTAPEWDLPAASSGPRGHAGDDYPSYNSLLDEASAVGNEFQEAASDNEDWPNPPETTRTIPRPYRMHAFHSKHKCCDLAFLPSGTIALALKKGGMREYEIFSFAQKSSWKPDKHVFLRKKDSIGTVDALSDERILVGMLWAQELVVLRRDPERPSFWKIDQHIDVSPTTPYRISTWGPDLVVCTGNQVARGNCHPGRHLFVKDIKHPKQYFMPKMLPFWIYCVAITEEFVVAASYYKQRLHGMPAQYLLQAFSHAGIEVWHFESDERICDITYSSSRDLFYLVHHSRKRIRILRKTTRSANPEVCEQTFEFSGSKLKPIAASADRNGNALAVLNDDFVEIAFSLLEPSSGPE